jgi:hypothetical protein
MTKRFALLLISVVATGEAVAQPADPTIIVSASPTTKDEIRREAEDYVSATGIAEGTRPAARWTDPICPSIIGVSADNAETVRAKLISVAGDVGVAVAKQPCKSNIVIAFALNGSDLARKIALDKRKTRAITAANRDKLVESELPVRWWYSTETRAHSGMRSTTGQLPWTGGDSSNEPGGGGQQGGGSPLNGIPTIVQNKSSIVSTQVARALVSATVIIDANLAKGAPLDAVAAQIAMVALAEIDLDAKPAGSILSLFPAKIGVDDLSANDRAALKSLYSLPLDRNARFHRGRLLQDIVEARLPEKYTK